MEVKEKNRFHIVVDEAVATYVMFTSCWKYLSSPMLFPSRDIFKAFDGHNFQPHGILTTFPINVGGKTIFIDVEVVDVYLEYNLLLRNTWIYEIKEAISSLFRVIKFPH